MKRESSERRCPRTLGWGLVLLVALVVVPASVAWAGDDAAKREVKQVKGRIEALLREADELEEAGRIDAAREAMARARQLKGRLAEYLARRARDEKAQAKPKKKKERKSKEKRGGDKKGNAKKGKEKGHGAKSDHDPRRILAGLAQGIKALQALGGQEEAIKHLMHVAQGLKKRMAMAQGKERGANKELEVAKRQLRLLHMAHDALREARHGEMAEIAEHAAHALELRLARRRDAEARHILETAPGREGVIHALAVAAEVLADQGKKDRAHMLMKHVHQAKEAHAKARKAQAERGKRERETGRDRNKRSDRDQLRHEIEVLHLALPVLREEGREKAIEIVERAIHARKLMHEGRRDGEAREIIADQPPPAHVAEIMLFAADLWRKYKDPKKAETCSELGRRYQQVAQRHRERQEREHEGRGHDGREREHDGREHRERERREREHVDRDRPAMERLEILQRQVNELQEALRRIQGELREFARRR